jgi:putative membrane protein
MAAIAPVRGDLYDGSMTAPTQRPDPADRHLKLAEDQTLLSSERTYAGWLRTSLTAIAVSLAFTALFRDSDTVWAAKGIATLFLLLAIGVLVAADRRTVAVQQRLNAHVVRGASALSIRLITWASALATLALMATIWLLV